MNLPAGMRHPTRERKPFPGTKVYITGTRDNGDTGVVQLQQGNGCIIKLSSGKLKHFYTHQLIEILT